MSCCNKESNIAIARYILNKLLQMSYNVRNNMHYKDYIAINCVTNIVLAICKFTVTVRRVPIIYRMTCIM